MVYTISRGGIVSNMPGNCPWSKRGLVAATAEKTGLKAYEVQHVVDTYLAEVTKQLKSHGKLKLGGFLVDAGEICAGEGRQDRQKAVLGKRRLGVQRSWCTQEGCHPSDV